MAAPSTFVVLFFSLVLCALALEQQPARGRRSKRDFMASMASFFSGVDKRLAALEASRDNSTEERVAQMEGKMQEGLQDMEKKLQGMQDGMQKLESMMDVMTDKMAEMVEAKANATEASAASLEATKTEPQYNSATCQYKYQYQFEQESSGSSGEKQRMEKLESELTRLQEKMSVLDKRLQDNDRSVVSLHNASVLAMEGVVRSITELVADTDENLRSIMRNATEILTLMMSNLEARLHAGAESTTAAVNASITRGEQTTRELATHVSALRDKLDNATSLHAEETKNTRAMLEDLKNTTKEMCGPPQYRRTCQDYYDNGQRTSGLYSLELEDGQGLMEVYCDMRNGTGWVVFQRREDGSIDFYRDWRSYKEGFGDLLREFWLGNRNIHRLTSAGLTQLRVDLQAWNGSTAFASYSHFSVGDASSSYRLSVSGYSGTAGDSLEYHNNQKFSTHDQDNDDYSGSCAQSHKGAWWYKACHQSNLNGQYGPRGSSGYQYIVWSHWLDIQSLQRTELKLK